MSLFYGILSCSMSLLRELHACPPAGLLAEKDSNYCICRTPCNLTRYNKELSMVKIPSKTSAKYLEKKFNKSEKYIS